MLPVHAFWIITIQTALCHTIGTGEVDDLCFEKSNKTNYIK